MVNKFTIIFILICREGNLFGKFIFSVNISHFSTFNIEKEEEVIQASTEVGDTTSKTITSVAMINDDDVSEEVAGILAAVLQTDSSFIPSFAINSTRNSKTSGILLKQIILKILP